MAATCSNRTHFGYHDFDMTRAQTGYPKGCPVRGCQTALQGAPYHGRTMPWCPEHGIRLHTNTFVYWNGPDAGFDPRTRNFVLEPDLALNLAINSKAKAETYRLGYETSEDALSWNVFVGLAKARRLREAASALIGAPVASEPALYLWGRRIDPFGVQVAEEFAPLKAVRDSLEKDIRRFKTEPDIMLMVNGGPVICVEAKFTSGNPMTYESAAKDGEKPTARAQVLERYLGRNSPIASATVRVERLGEQFHSQLFRNIVFAAEMAAALPSRNQWYVVNLVSQTQWQRPSGSTSRSARYSIENPEAAVRSYLPDDEQGRFTFRTWEDLYTRVIQTDDSLRELKSYMTDHSAHYQRAFDIPSD